MLRGGWGGVKQFMHRKQWIALCLSLFLGPGAGHIYLKQRAKGYLIGFSVMAILLTLMIIFIWNVIGLTRGVPLDQTNLVGTVLQLLQNGFMKNALVHVIGLGLITGIWIYTAWDCTKI